jgi:hypothetical protein
MNSSLKKLLTIGKNTGELEISVGIVEIKKIRPLAENGMYPLLLIQTITSESDAGGNINLSQIASRLVKYATPNSEPKNALEGALKHFTGLDDVSLLTMEDIAHIIVAVVELHRDFFQQAAPALMARLAKVLKG